jgi:prepilin-type N-terminal cleavage/methylation domain-containing protein
MMIGLHHNYKRKQNGYTLIELLLVVIVIAVLAALAVKTYRDKAASDRINIAALNIQHVLEAGMSYNVANAGLWPVINWSASGCASGDSVDDKNFVKNYLPNESNQSNFGTALCWSGDDPNDPTKAQKGKRFWVAMNVGSDTDAANTAARIAARLPNAIITNDPSQESTTTPNNSCASGQPCYVKAVVTVPSASVENNHMYVAGVGNCDPALDHTIQQPGSGVGVSCQRTTLGEQYQSQFPGDTDDSLSQYVISFECNPGEIPNLYATPNFLLMDRDSRSQNFIAEPLYTLSGVPQDNATYSKICDDTTPASGVVSCTLSVQASYNGQNGGPANMDIVGCTTKTNGKVCQCQMTVAGGCPNLPGAVGASYIAVCNPASSSVALTGKDNLNKW